MAEKDNSVPAIQTTTMRKLPCGRAGEAGEADGAVIEGTALQRRRDLWHDGVAAPGTPF